MSLFVVICLSVSISVEAAKLRCESIWRDERLSSDLLEKIPNPLSGPGFIVPNEREIGTVASSFTSLNEGLYVTVGTERGLMSAALAQGKIKALVQVDRDDKVVLYNLVNRALLAVAKNREHYLELRLKASHSEWIKALDHSRIDISLEDRRTLARAEAWEWWQQNVQHLADWQRFHQEPERNEDRAYQGANYLFDDALFSSVSELAKSQNIFVVHDLLGTETFLRRVSRIVEALNLKISAIDMSNAWQQGYLGHQNTVLFFNSLKNLMRNDAHYIFTYMSNVNAGQSAASAFKYIFVDRGPLTPDQNLEAIMGNMARSEPSRGAPQRSRVGRYDDF